MRRPGKQVALALAISVTLILSAPALASNNTGTVELGMGLSGEGVVSTSANNLIGFTNDASLEFPFRVRVGTFLTENTQVETYLNLKFLSGNFEAGGSLGFTYHFENRQSAVVPYLGAFGTLDRQQTRFGDRERFGLGFKIGVKVLENKTSPRIEVFVLRRFKNLDFQSDVLLGLNIGFSIFFKSNSAWDK